MWPPPDPTAAASFERLGEGDDETDAWEFDTEFYPDYEPPAPSWWRQQSAIVAVSSGVVLVLVGVVAVTLFAGTPTEGTRRIPDRIGPTSVVLMTSSTNSTTTTTTQPAAPPGPTSSLPVRPAVVWRPPSSPAWRPPTSSTTTTSSSTTTATSSSTSTSTSTTTPRVTTTVVTTTQRRS